MARTSLEDATAKALDLLPHDDPARSDPRLVRDAKCLQEIRATQEAAADVWLAASPLCAAPPDVLSSLMSKVEVRTPLAHRHVRFFPWLAASGWVAAAITFVLWPRDGEKASTVATVDPPVYLPPQSIRSEIAAAPAKAAAPVELPALADRRAIPHDRRMREELLRLQAEMNSFEEQGALSAPRVLGLHSPDALQPEPEEVQRRVVAALADALGSLLELERGASGDPARLVLQRGWLPEGFIPSEGEYIRHLNFPAHAADDYGLMVSGEGAYYDEAKDMVWSPDGNGRGYLGRRATAEDDLAAFQVPDENTLADNTVAMQPQPEGFVIEDPASNTAKVLIDQVPPPAAGYEQVVLWTDSAGNEARIPVQNSMAAPATAASSSSSAAAKELSASAELSIPVLPSMAQAGTCRLFFSLPDSNGVKSFRLIELPSVANGTPPKIIVSGERRGHGHGHGPKLK
jgi:hypothetical protein